MTSRISFSVAKDGHTFVFAFDPAEREEAISALLDYAVDGRYALGAREVFYVIRALRELPAAPTPRGTGVRDRRG